MERNFFIMMDNNTYSICSTSAKVKDNPLQRSWANRNICNDLKAEEQCCISEALRSRAITAADYQSITHRVPSLPIDLQADVGEDF